MTYKHDTQVGGTHYDQGDKPQHWDLATIYQWDPFQYQITKYVMRWKTKHPTPEKKLEDLLKARSFLDKYIKEYEAWLPKMDTPATREALDRVWHVLKKHGAHPGRTDDTIWDAVNAALAGASTGQVSTPYWQNEGFYGNMECLWSCRICKHKVRAINAPQEPHGCAPKATPQATT